MLRTKLSNNRVSSAGLCKAQWLDCKKQGNNSWAHFNRIRFFHLLEL